MDRAEWQQLAEERALDAQALLAAHRWSGAYYLAGYAIECALKSCVLVRLVREPQVVFVEKRFSEKCWTHGLEELVALTGLAKDLADDGSKNPVLNAYWEIVIGWSEQDRYRIKDESQARKLVTAVTDNANGVLQWIRARW